MKNMIAAILLILFSQILVYVQLQGQFFSTWIKQNSLAVSLMGVPISLLLIEYTKRVVTHFNGETWPGRLIGFAAGIIVFAAMSYLIFNETLTTKTIVSIFLAAVIVLIRLFF